MNHPKTGRQRHAPGSLDASRPRRLLPVAAAVVVALGSLLPVVAQAADPSADASAAPAATAGSTSPNPAAAAGPGILGADVLVYRDAFDSAADWIDLGQDENGRTSLEDGSLYMSIRGQDANYRDWYELAEPAPVLRVEALVEIDDRASHGRWRGLRLRAGRASLVHRRGEQCRRVVLRTADRGPLPAHRPWPADAAHQAIGGGRAGRHRMRRGPGRRRRLRGHQRGWAPGERGHGAGPSRHPGGTLRPGRDSTWPPTQAWAARGSTTWPCTWAPSMRGRRWTATPTRRASETRRPGVDHAGRCAIFRRRPALVVAVRRVCAGRTI